MEIAEFLLARIGEDEAVAKAATRGPWVFEHGSIYVERHVSRDPIEVVDITWDPEGDGDGTLLLTDEDGMHIARHSPARVLVECEAKRGLVVMCQPDPIDAQLRKLGTTNPAAWNLIGPLVEQAEEERWTTLRILAAVYADHPDYRSEWKP